MKQKILISIGAIILGASTLTIGYAASNSGKEGRNCENMMSEHMGKAEMNCHRGMMGKDHVMGREGGSMMSKHMGMMANEMPKECQEMMRKHGMVGTESPGAGPAAPAS